MPDRGRHDIIYAEPLLADERRRAALNLMQRRGLLISWGMNEGHFLVERKPGQMEALRAEEVERLIHDFLVALDQLVPLDTPLNL